MEHRLETESVDLIMTSPSFGLVRKKDYGNVDSEQPLSTKELHPKKEMLLDLCSDEELVINDQSFGKRWKHGVRNLKYS